MLLVIHNLPLNTRFGDVKSLLLEKCGLRNLILDKLIYEDNAMKITVGLPTEEDAAFLVRKINGLFLKGHQLYVQDLRQKPSEQPYRLPNPTTQEDNDHQNWNTDEQQGWNNTPQQSWNNSPQKSWNNSSQQSWNNSSQQSWNNSSQQSWNNSSQQSWNNSSQQSWNNSSQQSWNNSSQQSWNNSSQQSCNNSSQQNWNNPSQNRNNESQRNSVLYQPQNQNVQGGYGQELSAAATMWAQRSQQVNTMYDSQSVHYPQTVQYPTQSSQVDNQGYGVWGQSSLGFEQGSGDFTNSNTSWGESSVPAQSRGRSQETRKFNDSRRSRSDRSFERDSRDHSGQYSQPREERFGRPQAGDKRRWDDDEHRDDDGWRQRPASPPRRFRQHHQGRDKGAPQRSGFEFEPMPWADAPNQRFEPSKPRFEAPKQGFQGSKPRFEAPKPKFDKKQKFNAPNQKFNAPNQKFNAPNQKFNAPNQKFNAPNQKFNAPNQKFNATNQKFNAPNQKFKPKFNSSFSGPRGGNPSNTNKLESIPWDKMGEQQKQKILKKNEFFRRNTVNRITIDIFNDLGISQDDIDLKTYFTDPVRSRLDKVLGDEKFTRVDMMYANYLDVYNDEKEKILEEAKQLQKDGVEPKLQQLFIKPVFGKPQSTESVVTSHISQAKRFKADGEIATGPRPGSSKPVDGKIPSYIDGDKKKFKVLKQQHLKDMVTLRCPDVGPQLDEIVNEEIESIAKIFLKVIEASPDENQKAFLRDRANEECIEDFKMMFKQKICQRLADEGAKIVRIYAQTGKPPKKAELEPFLRPYGVLALKKSDRKPFFTAHLKSYKTLDELCNMGSVRVGNSEVIFKPLHMTPKFKRIHISSLKRMRDKYVSSQIRKPEVNILTEDWEIKLAAIKEKELLKQQKAEEDAAKEEILKQEKAAKDEIKETVKAENVDVQPESGEVKPGNVDAKPENGEAKPEIDSIIIENDDVKLEKENVKAENQNTDVHTDKYGDLHSNFNVIDEVQGSDAENDQNIAFNITNNDFNDDEAPAKSDESILRDFPVGADHEIIFEDDDSENDDGDQALAEDIDLDNIDENDLEDY